MSQYAIDKLHQITTFILDTGIEENMSGDDVLYELYRHHFQAMLINEGKSQGDVDLMQEFKENPLPKYTRDDSATPKLMGTILSQYFSYVSLYSGFQGSLAHFWTTKGLIMALYEVCHPYEELLCQN